MQNIHTFSIYLLPLHPNDPISLVSFLNAKHPCSSTMLLFIRGWDLSGWGWSTHRVTESVLIRIQQDPGRVVALRTPISKGYSVDVRPTAQCQNALAISVSRRIISCGTEYFHVMWDCRQATVIQRRNEDSGDPCTPACQDDLKEHTGEVV